MLVAGITIALLAFIFIESLIHAWHSGVRASAKNRLITRNKVSIILPLPLSYERQIRNIPDVEKVGIANWFGGIYKEEKHRFPQFAINEEYLDLYPQFVFHSDEKENFLRDRRGVAIGQALSDQYGIKVGDSLSLKGTIYPGIWEFKVRAVFTGREKNISTKMFLFNWDYFNEQIKLLNETPDQVGIFVVGITSTSNPDSVASQIDSLFKNSYAETLTENETSFQQSFLSMSQTIIWALHSISLVIVTVISLVLSNVLLMSARERTQEQAILRTIGFQPIHLFFVTLLEASIILVTSLIFTWGIAAIIFSLPPSSILGNLAQFFPVFEINPLLIIWTFLGAILVSIIACLGPLISGLRIPVAEALRKID